MSRITAGRVVGCLALGLCTGWYVWGQEGGRPDPGRAGNTVQAQQPPKGGGAGTKPQRLLYLVKRWDAKELAGTLGKHFKGEADVEILPDPTSNALLLSAAPATLTEVVKLLEQLDRRPHVVAVQILIVELAPKRGADPGPGLDEREFTGPVNDVLAKVEALKKKGQVEGLRRIYLTAVENQPATLRDGAAKPYVTGIQQGLGKGGASSKTILYRDMGTVVTLTPRVTPQKTVRMDLRVEDARARMPEDGVVLGLDENGVAIRATEFINATVDTKLDVPAGQALLVRGVKTVSPSGQAQTLMIVAAQVLEPEAKAGK